MRNMRVPWWYLVGLGLLVGTGMACGDDPPPQTDCGEGTVLESLECVPEETAQCSEGEVLRPDGECAEPGDFACREGTRYDQGLDECVSDADIQCGEGTVEVDGECVIEDPLVCGEGTVLYDGECLVTEEVCGEGTSFEGETVECYVDEEACGTGAQFDLAAQECVDTNLVEECGEGAYELDDRCLPLDSFADELADEADVDYADGTSMTPSADEEIVFKGTFDDELTHQFEVDGTEGQWIEIAIYSRGLPSPGFTFEKSIDGDWSREVTPGTVTTPKRTALLPADEVFELNVETSMSSYPDWGDQGHESWKYVGTLEVLEAPTPTEWDAFVDIHDGQLDATTDNFLKIDVEDAFETILSITDLGDSARDATLELWDEPDAYDQRFSIDAGDTLELDTDEESTLYMHLDAVEFEGGDLDYELQATTTEALDPGDFYEEEVEVQAGEVVFISHESDQAAAVDTEVRLNGTQEYLFSGMVAANQSSYDADETKRQFFYARESGTYTIRYYNNSFSTITSFVTLTETDDDVPVFEVPDDDGLHDFSAQIDDQDLEPGDWRFVVVDTPDTSQYEVTIEAGSGTPMGSAYTDATREQIADASGSSGTTQFDFNVDEEGIYYVVARPESTVTDVADLDFEISGQTVDPLESGDTHTETFDADAFDLLKLDVSWGLDGEVEARLYNDAGGLVWDDATDEQIDAMTLLPGTGEYTLEVENIGDESMLGLSTDIDVRSTFDNLFVGSDVSESWVRPALSEGEHDYLVVSPGDTVEASVDIDYGSDEEARLTLWDLDDGEIIDEVEETGSIEMTVPLLPTSTYAFGVEALEDFGDDYDFEFEAIETNEISASSEPQIEIEYTAVDTLTMGSCPEIEDIEVFVDIDHWWRGDLIVDITGPSGTVARIHDESGGSTDDIVGTYPYPSDGGLEDGEQLFDFIGEDGSGEWQIEVVDTWEPSSNIGTLNEWSVTLDCAD